MTPGWSLGCSDCGATRERDFELATVCPACGAPWLVRHRHLPPPGLKTSLSGRPWSMWRYREWLPLREGEEPVTLGEGGTPLLAAPGLANDLRLPRLWIKDESQNPTGSFKARGLSAAVSRARADGARALTVPTAGNAGAALSAYGRRAGLPVRVFAPVSTPPRILELIRSFGAELDLIDGHIGDCGAAARAFAVAHQVHDVSTLREPYRIEGKKTMALEVAEQLGWELPDCVLYPTGGGTGLIGMWRAFEDLSTAGWVGPKVTRLYAVQATGCQPVVRAFQAGAARTEPWENPQTHAAGLRVPAPLGGALILQALRATGGGAVAVTDGEMREAQDRLSAREGIDAGPEGGAALAGLERLLAQGVIRRHEVVVVFNTGAGWLYRA